LSITTGDDSERLGRLRFQWRLPVFASRQVMRPESVVMNSLPLSHAGELAASDPT
jgi:hypothetical protein